MSAIPETQAERDAADVTVVTCKCGAVVLLSVTATTTPEFKKEIMDYIQAGASVTHMPAVEARKLNFGRCKCERKSS
jgi:hypothetical protein